MGSELNLSAIREALKRSPSKPYRAEELKGLNHLFQSCETGAISEYGNIEETVSPILLQTISTWLAEIGLP